MAIKVDLTERAKQDIAHIFEYYQFKAGLKVAKQEVSKILKRIKILNNFPFAGQKEENEKTKDFDCRYLVQGNHKILYEVEEKQINVLTIFNTSQHPNKMSI
jgi:toxin ParE1/3/4